MHVNIILCILSRLTRDPVMERSCSVFPVLQIAVRGYSVPDYCNYVVLIAKRRTWCHLPHKLMVVVVHCVYTLYTNTIKKQN